MGFLDELEEALPDLEPGEKPETPERRLVTFRLEPRLKKAFDLKRHRLSVSQQEVLEGLVEEWVIGGLPD